MPIKVILYNNSANVSLCQLCTQFHPIAYPEFPLHMWTNVLLMISPLFYNLQNNFNKILTTAWTVRGSNSNGGEIFHTCPERHRAHPVTCTMDTVSLQGEKNSQYVKLTPHLLLMPWSWKVRCIPLLPQWAVRLVQSLSVCRKVHFNFFLNKISIFFFFLKNSERRGHNIS
jgi:hypothetical protein